MYSPLELYNTNTKQFICPECYEKLSFIALPNSNDSENVYGICNQCRSEILVSPPSIKKKLIYVDSWFVSGIFDSDSSSNKELFESILAKLRELDRLQKIQIVVSDIHAQEIARIPAEYDPATLWGEIISLASGLVTKHPTDVLVEQYKKRIFDKQIDFQWSDLFDNNPHFWNPGTKIILNSSWMLNLHNRFDQGYENINNEFRRLLSNQINDPERDGDSPEECFEYINQLNREDTLKGIEYRKQSLNFEKCMESWIDGNAALEDMPTGAEVLLVHPGRQIYYALIQDIIGYFQTQSEEIKRLDALEDFLKSGKNLPTSVLISNAIEGFRLHLAIQANRQGSGVTQNEEKFTKKYGVSAVNDTSHISTFAPYVDIMLVDNNARKILQADFLQQFLSGLPCEFYSSNTLNEFDGHLDKLMDQKETREFHLARKLLVGQTKKEFSKEIKQLVIGKLKSIILQHKKS